MAKRKTVSGIIAQIGFSKDSKNTLLTIKKESTPLTMEMAKMLAGESASNTEIIDLIQNSQKVSFEKVWVNSKIANFAVNGDVSEQITLGQVKGREFFCQFHLSGEMIGENNDIPVEGDNKLVDNNSIVIS